MNTQHYQRPELSEIRAIANGRWHAILAGLGVPEIYLNTRKHAPCPSCGGRDRYRFTNYQGNGGFICNQCTPEGGSGFDLLMLVYGYNFGESVKLVSNRLGLTQKHDTTPPKRPPKPITPPSQPTAPVDKLERLNAILNGATPIAESTPAGQYLTGRGLRWNAIADGLNNLFYHHAVDYWAFSEAQNKPLKIGAFPAMIAVISRGDDGAVLGFSSNPNRVLGLHITYLQNTPQTDAQGGTVAAWQKLAIVHPETGEPLPAKKMQSRYQGALTGAAVQLYPPSDSGMIAVCEGIETALAAHVLFNLPNTKAGEWCGLPIWAALSAVGLKNIDLPDTVKALSIIADNDTNSTGQRAAHALGIRALKAGIEVARWQPSTAGNDALDVLNQQQGQTQ